MKEAELKKMPSEEIYRLLEEKIETLDNMFQEIKTITFVIKDRLSSPNKPEGEPKELTEILEKKVYYELQKIPSVGVSRISSICYIVYTDFPHLNGERDVTIRNLCAEWFRLPRRCYGVGEVTKKVIYEYLTKVLKIPESYFCNN